MPVVVTADAYLEVNGVKLATPAWRVTDLSPLLDDAPLRGSDRVISGASGSRPYPRVRAARVLTFPLTVFGAHDMNGAANANPRQGLITNVEYLKANLGIASSVGDGTVTAIWHRFTGADKTADVHVLGLIGFRRVSPTVARTTLDLSIPGGAGFA